MNTCKCKNPDIERDNDILFCLKCLKEIEQEEPAFDLEYERWEENEKDKELEEMVKGVKGGDL